MKRLRILAACLALAACAAEASDEGAEFSSDALVEGHGGIKGPVQVEPEYVVPPGVIYIAPTYALPAPGYYWRHHRHYGWGWRHGSRGWHRGWR